MKLPETASVSDIKRFDEGQISPGSSNTVQDHVYSACYVFLLAGSFSVWFVAIRAPLWLDETLSFYVIRRGFGQIISRQGGLASPAYYCILLLWTKIAGTGEITLRIPSILAMLAAIYILFLAARELFGDDNALIAATVFFVNPIVIFASIDIRPYAFAVLATTISILTLVRLRQSTSNFVAALFGLSAAVIVNLHFIYGAILPALALGFFIVKVDDRRNFWRQCALALCVFFLAFLPVIPGLLFVFRTAGTHVIEVSPTLKDLAWTLAPTWMIYALAGTAILAAFARKITFSTKFDTWRVLLCCTLALVPTLILYGISVATPLHIFLFRYRLVAIPGVALCWSLLMSRVDSRMLKLLFCVILVSATAYQYLTLPIYRLHGYSWKQALEIAEMNAAPDHAPVLICSDVIEADNSPMPVGAQVKDSAFFAQLSYYKLDAPVVGLPRAMNEQAVRIGSDFVQEATKRRQRFLAMGYTYSYDTLHWLISATSATYDVRVLGQPSWVVVLEFTPRPEPVAPHSP